MEIFCTYCSWPKQKTAGKIPAIRRYKSRRIRSVYESAKKLGIPFYILSGLFGLTHAEEPIPYYDHLLAPDEIQPMAIKAFKVITKLKIKKILFFINSFQDDQNNYPYVAAIMLGCEMAKIELSVVTITQSD